MTLLSRKHKHITFTMKWLTACLLSKKHAVEEDELLSWALFSSSRTEDGRYLGSYPCSVRNWRYIRPFFSDFVTTVPSLAYKEYITLFFNSYSTPRARTPSPHQPCKEYIYLSVLLFLNPSFSLGAFIREALTY